LWILVEAATLKIEIFVKGRSPLAGHTPFEVDSITYQIGHSFEFLLQQGSVLLAFLLSAPISRLDIVLVVCLLAQKIFEQSLRF
jgi:hypothetical protein